MKNILLLIILISSLLSCSNPSEEEHTQWSQDELIVPAAIRQPNESDLLKDSTLTVWKERKTVALTEGFILSINDVQKNLNFDFYCEINVDNPKVWPVAKKLLSNIKGECRSLYNLHGEKVSHGNKLDIATIVSKLQAIETDITNNCNFSIGVIQQDSSLQEVFIDESKYIKYWGSNEQFFRGVMKEFNIEEKETMNFVDEYPKTVYEWSAMNQGAKTNAEVMQYLKREL